MSSLKALATELSRRGPHRVLRGDLALAGQPGLVFTPGEGLGLPAVAFAHGWLSGVSGYVSMLEHLASWGIVAAAPDTERGPFASHVGLATDLLTVLDIATGVRLGPGEISVHPDRLAVAGHGMGAGVAVIAASKRPSIAAVAALFPEPVAPSAVELASGVDAAALVLSGATVSAEAKALAGAWGGACALRSVAKAGDSGGLVNGRRVLKFLGADEAEKKTQAAVRVLLTGFLLYSIGGDKKYKDFADLESELPKTLLVDPNAEEPEKKSSAIGQISQLLRR